MDSSAMANQDSHNYPPIDRTRSLDDYIWIGFANGYKKEISALLEEDAYVRTNTKIFIKLNLLSYLKEKLGNTGLKLEYEYWIFALQSAISGKDYLWFLSKSGSPDEKAHNVYFYDCHFEKYVYDSSHKNHRQRIIFDSCYLKQVEIMDVKSETIFPRFIDSAIQTLHTKVPLQEESFKQGDRGINAIEALFSEVSEVALSECHLSIFILSSFNPYKVSLRDCVFSYNFFRSDCKRYTYDRKKDLQTIYSRAFATYRKLLGNPELASQSEPITKYMYDYKTRIKQRWWRFDRPISRFLFWINQAYYAFLFPFLLFLFSFSCYLFLLKENGLPVGVSMADAIMFFSPSSKIWKHYFFKDFLADDSVLAWDKFAAFLLIPVVYFFSASAIALKRKLGFQKIDSSQSPTEQSNQ